jgi:hypothetical protein
VLHHRPEEVGVHGRLPVGRGAVVRPAPAR